MNIIYETTKERGATILMPTAMVDSMNPGGLVGLAQAAADAQQKPTPREAPAPATQPAKRAAARPAKTPSRRIYDAG
jgi:hypothetical protein